MHLERKAAERRAAGLPDPSEEYRASTMTRPVIKTESRRTKSHAQGFSVLGSQNVGKDHKYEVRSIRFNWEKATFYSTLAISFWRSRNAISN